MADCSDICHSVEDDDMPKVTATKRKKMRAPRVSRQVLLVLADYATLLWRNLPDLLHS